MGLLSPQIFLNPCSPLQGPPGVPLDLPTTPPVILFFRISRLVRWLAPGDRRDGVEVGAWIGVSFEDVTYANSINTSRGESMSGLSSIAFFLAVIVGISMGSFTAFVVTLVLSFVGVLAFAVWLDIEAADETERLRIAYEEALAGTDKADALEKGRDYYRAQRGDGSLTVYDEQAIANDLETMN